MVSENKHDESSDDALWADQDVAHPRTDADRMFGQLLDIQDALEQDDVNIVGRARHEPESEEGAVLKEPSRAELPETVEHGLVRRYFQKRFKKH